MINKILCFFGKHVWIEWVWVNYNAIDEDSSLYDGENSGATCKHCGDRK